MQLPFCVVLLMGAVFAAKSSAFELSAKDANGKNVPIEIDAKSGITCEQKGRVCTAQGDVIVTQGATKLTCDTLKAFFHMNKNGAPEGLQRLEAHGRVHMTNPEGGQEARAARADFDVENAHLTMTGGPLTLTVGGTHVAAKEALEYFDHDNKAMARGDVRITKEDKLLCAQEIDAYFKKDQEGKSKLDRLEARRDVFVSTPQDVAQGNAGTYTDGDEVVILEGNVRLTKKGQGQMVGERGRFDMKNGASVLLPAKGVDKNALPATMGADQKPTSTGRVKVLLLPQKKKDVSGA